MARSPLILALLLAAAMPVAAAAQPVTSAGPEKVAVTIYRNPGRSADDELELSWLNGFALVSETRTIAIPAGRATIRFEGVAGGIVPETAVVTGSVGSGSVSLPARIPHRRLGYG